MAATSSFAGVGKGGGGIVPVTSLSRTLSQSSGFFAAEASSVNASRLTFATFSFALWQPVQFFERNGRMRESKVCLFCAAAFGLHVKKMQPKRPSDTAGMRIQVDRNFTNPTSRRQAFTNAR